jgi:hypothetical protein
MFESGMASDGSGAIPPLARPKRAFMWGLTLLIVGFATYLVWGVVDNIQEVADRTH